MLEVLDALWRDKDRIVAPASALLIDVDATMVALRAPGVARLSLHPSLATLALDLGTKDEEELRRNPEYQPQTNLTWCEFDTAAVVHPNGLPNAKPEAFPRFAVCLNGSKYFVAMTTFRNKAFVSYAGDLSTGEKFTGLMDTAYELNACLGLLAGVIRLFNVVPPHFIDKTDAKMRCYGRKFNGMPFSPVAFSSVSLRGYKKIGDEHTATDEHGMRFHFVRGHYMFAPTKNERVWRRSHWRGDPALGTTRSVHT